MPIYKNIAISICYVINWRKGVLLGQGSCFNDATKMRKAEEDFNHNDQELQKLKWHETLCNIYCNKFATKGKL
jgi:hypothetical protein